MPDKTTLKRARADARQGKSPSTQAGEFVREEIHHIREGKHGARSAKQAIAIGLSKARKAGVALPAAPAARKISASRNYPIRNAPAELRVDREAQTRDAGRVEEGAANRRFACCVIASCACERRGTRHREFACSREKSCRDASSASTANVEACPLNSPIDKEAGFSPSPLRHRDTLPRA